MKSLRLLFTGLLLVGAASAQALSPGTGPPDVTVTKISLKKEVFVAALYDDPFRANEEQAQLVRDQKRTIRENVVRAQSGEVPLPLPSHKASPPTTASPSSLNYLYEAKVKNTGTKTIRSLVWVYTLFDPDTHAEVGHQRFNSVVNIRPGKTGNLLGRSTVIPVKIVNAKKPGKESERKYGERVLIDRLEYDDGTFWQRATK